MKKALILVALLACASGAHAQVTAATCNPSDIVSAFATVTAGTLTFTIPGGNCTWTSGVTLTQPSGSTSLTIQGSTTVNCTGTPGTSGYSCTPTDSTIIVDSVPSSTAILTINVASGTSLLRVTGLTFKGGNPGAGNTKYNGMVVMSGTSTNARMDHLHFNVTTYSSGGGSSSTQWEGCLYGVIDHSVFDMDASSTDNGVRAYNSGTCNSDALGIGDQSWTQATGFGSANFLYMEANQFNNGATNDCTDGGRYISRYNYFNMSAPPPSVQTHPTGGGGRIRGCRASEVYHNFFHAQSANYINTADWLSSGTHLIWGNATDSSSAGGGTGFRSLLSVHNMRNDNSTYGQGVPPNGWGYCGTSSGLPGDGSNWDGSQGSTGYPCLDQPGRGAGDLLTGGFTSDGSGSNNVKNNAATGCIYSATCAYPRQVLEPIYEWMDAYSSSPVKSFWRLCTEWSRQYGKHGHLSRHDRFRNGHHFYRGAHLLDCSALWRGSGAAFRAAFHLYSDGRLLGDGHEHALPVQDDEHLDGLLYAVHVSTPVDGREYPACPVRSYRDEFKLDVGMPDTRPRVAKGESVIEGGRRRYS